MHKTWNRGGKFPKVINALMANSFGDTPKLSLISIDTLNCKSESEVEGRPGRSPDASPF